MARENEPDHGNKIQSNNPGQKQSFTSASMFRRSKLDRDKKKLANRYSVRVSFVLYVW
jgi:hypothetical protein